MLPTLDKLADDPRFRAFVVASRLSGSVECRIVYKKRSKFVERVTSDHLELDKFGDIIQYDLAYRGHDPKSEDLIWYNYADDVFWAIPAEMAIQG